MNLSSTIAPHLPYLRRFSRALTGDQRSGDTYVAAMLEALVEDPSSFPEDLDARVATYRTFLKIWDSVSVNLEAESDEETDGSTLRRVTPKPRQAFLLAAVEDFTTEETSTILALPVEDVRNLIDQAGREIAEQVTTDVLIIEDEPIISLDLQDLVEDLGHSVTGIARTHDQALDLVKEQVPGLVLADIQLADGSSGLDAVNEMLNSFEVPVIFITAYPDRLLTGTRPEPTYLITKPFKGETVKAIISQALFFNEKASKPL
jgi:DNA-directed RNA polymerase specialized sigma24 family protein